MVSSGAKTRLSGVSYLRTALNRVLARLSQHRLKERIGDIANPVAISPARVVDESSFPASC